MQKALLIAEKPDLSRKIEAVYDKFRSRIPYQITFTAMRGHLIALKEPDELSPALKEWSWDTIPFNPEDYGGWQYKVIQEKKQGNFLTAQERYHIIETELQSGKYDFVINAGDPDQEGELLVRLVLSFARNTIPVKRFWTNAVTEDDILHALLHLREDDSDPVLLNLLAAAFGRQRSDYRFGMNLSRAATLQMQARVALGRVKTPMLAIVCKREQEIRDFVPKTKYGVRATYQEGFSGDMVDRAERDEKESFPPLWFETKDEAQNAINALPNKATVVSFEEKTTKTLPPKLFKLATAQIEAGKLGYDSSQTLAIIQSLYEKEIITYPRTDCEFLSSTEDFKKILHSLMTVPSLLKYVSGITDDDIQDVRNNKKWVNDKVLQEHGHSALMPTGKTPQYNQLSNEEIEIYEMVCKRFVSIFMPPTIQKKQVLITDIDGNYFKTTGVTTIDKGFAEIYNTTFTDTVIEAKRKGDVLGVHAYDLTETTSTCPKRYTTATLIAACEDPLKYLDDPSLKSLGKRLTIGRPATRDVIIRQLIQVDHYLETFKDKKTEYLKPTALGEDIIKNLGPLDICKVDLTGLWEEKLEMVRQGQLSLPDLEKGMKDHVKQMVGDIKNMPMQSLAHYQSIGNCPVCKRPLRHYAWGWGCSGYPDCTFGIGRVAGKTLTDTQVKQLLEKGQTGVIKDFKTKAGKKFSAALRFDENYKITFATAEHPSDIQIVCPTCGKDMRRLSWGWACSGYPDCSFAVGKIAGKELSDKEVQRLTQNGYLEKVSGFTSKKGTKFDAGLKIDNGKIQFVFD